MKMFKKIKTAMQEQRMRGKIIIELLSNIKPQSLILYLTKISVDQILVVRKAGLYSKILSKRNENSLRDRRDTILHSNINLTDSPKGEDRPKRTDSIFQRNNSMKQN